MQSTNNQPIQQVHNKFARIPNAERESLRQLFLSLTNSKNGTMSFQDFMGLFVHLNPNLKNNSIVSLAENAFISCDKDQNGSVK